MALLDSPAPYRPINPHGRSMPKDWKSPFNTELYAVVVYDEETKRATQVSPKMIKAVAESFLEALIDARKRGQLKSWTDPQIVLAYRRGIA